MRFQRGLQYFSWTVASIRVFSFFFFSFLFSLTHVHALNNIFDLCLQNYKLLQIHMHNTCFALWNTKLQPSKTTSVFFNYLAWDLVHNPKWSGYVIFSVDRCHMNRFTRTLISWQCRWLICFIKVLWTASPSFKGRRWFFFCSCVKYPRGWLYSLCGFRLWQTGFYSAVSVQGNTAASQQNVEFLYLISSPPLLCVNCQKSK